MYAKLSVIVDNMCVHFDCRKLSHKCIRIVLFARIAYIFARSSFVIPSSKYISQTQILCGNTDLFARSKRIRVLFTQFSNECSRNFCLPVTNNGCKIEENWRNGNGNDGNVKHSRTKICYIRDQKCRKTRMQNTCEECIFHQKEWIKYKVNAMHNAILYRVNKVPNLRYLFR